MHYNASSASVLVPLHGCSLVGEWRDRLLENNLANIWFDHTHSPLFTQLSMRASSALEQYDSVLFLCPKCRVIFLHQVGIFRSGTSPSSYTVKQYHIAYARDIAVM